MPKTKARSRRLAAPVDLREPVLPLERPDVPSTSGTNGRTKRRRSAPKENPRPQISLSGVGDNHTLTEHLALSQNTHISANDIAASLLSQLKNSGLTLAPLPLPVDSAIQNQTPPMSSQPTSPAIALNTAQRDNSTSQTLTHVTFQPPLTSDTELLQVHNGNASTGTPDCYISSVPLLKNSIPLGFNVNEKHRSLICGDMYVDFSSLLPSYKDDEDKVGEVLFENNNVTISNRKNKKDMFSIWQWANAYDIFMSIYLSNHSNSVLDLIKYGNNIRNMAKQFGFQAARAYDESFRKVRKYMNFEWGTINDELWRTAAYSNFSQGAIGSKNSLRINKPQSMPFHRRAQQQFPMGFCWAFCRSGVCNEQATCKLKHQCIHCNKKHCSTTCREGERGDNTKRSNANNNKGN